MHEVIQKCRSTITQTGFIPLLEQSPSHTIWQWNKQGPLIDISIAVHRGICPFFPFNIHHEQAHIRKHIYVLFCNSWNAQYQVAADTTSIYTFDAIMCSFDTGSGDCYLIASFSYNHDLPMGDFPTGVYMIEASICCSPCQFYFVQLLNCFSRWELLLPMYMNPVQHAWMTNSHWWDKYMA